MILCKVPDVRQATDYDCGSACIDAICDYWERRRPPRPLANHVQGMSPETMESVLRDRGFWVMRGEFYVPLLQSLTRGRVPVICAVTMEGDGHWVIATGASKNRVWFHDPDDGPSSVPLDEWQEMWTAESESGQLYHRWAIAPHIT